MTSYICVIRQGLIRIVDNEPSGAGGGAGQTAQSVVLRQRPSSQTNPSRTILSALTVGAVISWLAPQTQNVLIAFAEME